MIHEADWAAGPVAIVVAPTGAEVTRADNPAVPYTPGEIAREVIEAHAAGAAIAHLHVREANGAPSSRPELFRETIDLIRASCDIVTMVSTGGAIGMSVAQRAAGLEAAPEMAGIETGSTNFGEDLFPTTPAETRSIAQSARDRGIALEVEAFELSHVEAALAFAADGTLPRPLRFNLVLGVPGALSATHRNLATLAAAVPPECTWGVTAIGRHQRRLLALGALMGASCLRTGFEDGVYLERGRLAASNAELVTRVADDCRALGRHVATPSEARELLSL